MRCKLLSRKIPGAFRAERIYADSAVLGLYLAIIQRLPLITGRLHADYHAVELPPRNFTVADFLNLCCNASKAFAVATKRYRLARRSNWPRKFA
ncbi:MAG: hypothetical protein LBK41_06400 [Clostridiales bacterium]|nr:hypothetical protein [Clostridiales bacterium]